MDKTAALFDSRSDSSFQIQCGKEVMNRKRKWDPIEDEKIKINRG
jgi:hypothetical protein